MTNITNEMAEKVVDDLDVHGTEVALQVLHLATTHFQTERFERYWKDYILGLFWEANSYRKDYTTVRTFSVLEVREYTEEAEHQDGTGYWLQFTNAKEVLDDMEVYHANK